MQTQHPSPSATREAYRQKYEAEIKQWEAKLAHLKAESAKMSTDAKLALHPALERAQNAMDVANAKWARLTTAAEDGWEELMGDVESAWLDFKAKLEGAHDALKAHRSN